MTKKPSKKSGMIGTILIFIFSVGVACVVTYGVSYMHVQDGDPVVIQKTVAEEQLERFKQAELVCGKSNVVEKRPCNGEHAECRPEDAYYVCEDMHYAAMSPEERANEDKRRDEERKKSEAEFKNLRY